MLVYDLSSCHFCLYTSLKVRDFLVQQDCGGVWGGKGFVVLDIQNSTLLVETLFFFSSKAYMYKSWEYYLSFCEVVCYYKVKISPFYATFSSVELFNSLRVIILLFLNCERGREGNQI